MPQFKPAVRYLLLTTVSAAALGLAACGGRDAKNDTANAQPAAPKAAVATAPAQEIGRAHV